MGFSDCPNKGQFLQTENYVPLKQIPFSWYAKREHVCKGRCQKLDESQCYNCNNCHLINTVRPNWVIIINKTTTNLVLEKGMKSTLNIKIKSSDYHVPRTLRFVKCLISDWVTIRKKIKGLNLAKLVERKTKLLCFNIKLRYLKFCCCSHLIAIAYR